MQTQKGMASQGLVKEEFQEVLRCLLVPAIKTHVRKRERMQETGICGLEMGDIQAKLELELGGASELMLAGKWKCPIVNQLNKMEAHAKAAQAAALQAEIHHEQAHFWAHHAFSQAVDDADAIKLQSELARSGLDADAKRTAADDAKAKHDAMLCVCKPSDNIFFVSFDNCPSYSFLEGSSKVDIVPIVPWLQVCTSTVYLYV